MIFAMISRWILRAFSEFYFSLWTACAFGAGTFLSHRKNRKRIDDLTEYLEQVNIGAGGDIDTGEGR